MRTQPDLPVIRFDQLRDTLNTGDLVLFSGTSWSARAVKWCTWSRWSHVAIVLRLPERPEQPLLWEATRANPVPDIRAGRSFDGVQLVSLEDKLRLYPGQAVLRRLEGAGAPEQRLRLVERLLEEAWSRPYRDIVRKGVARLWQGAEASGLGWGAFCSELVAEVYKQWELLPPDTPSWRYLPSDFAPESRLALRGATLSPGWLLTPP